MMKERLLVIFVMASTMLNVQDSQKKLPRHSLTLSNTQGGHVAHAELLLDRLCRSSRSACLSFRNLLHN